MNSINIPTLRQLRYLVALDQQRHFGRAAHACGITQSTLSAALIELESLLGASLVERTKRKVVMTLLGSEVARQARRVLAEADILVDLAQAGREPLSGPLRLGMIPTVGPYLLPRILPGLRARYPALALFLVEDLTARLLDTLAAGELDAALLALPWDLEGLTAEVLFDDRFVVACRPQDPLATQDPIPAAELARAPLLLLAEGHCLRTHALEACAQLGDRITPFAATSLYTLVQMVGSGQGITLLPQLAVEGGILRGLDLVTRDFSDAGPGRQIALVWRSTSRRQSEFRTLARAIAELYGCNPGEAAAAA